MENRGDTHFKYSQHAAKRQYIFQKEAENRNITEQFQTNGQKDTNNVICFSTLKENKNCDVEQKGRI